MDTLSWIDNRTLLVCQCIVIAVFSLMLAGMRALNPGLRGITPVACGFALGLPAALLITASGRIPLAVSVVGGAAFAFLSALLLFRGVLEVCGAQEQRTISLLGPERTGQATSPAAFFPVLSVAMTVALLIVIYNTVIRLNISACIVAITGTLALSRGLMAWALFHCASGRVQMRAFSVSMSAFAAMTAVHAITTLFYPSYAETLERHSPHTFSLLTSVIFYCLQGVFYLLMFAEDITKTIHEEAQHDHLSGALNRRGMEDALAAELARIRRTGATFAVLLMDVDHFKSVNDRFGHAAGDEALRRVARGITSTIRAYDLLARFGGDEFLLLMPSANGDQAMQTASRIREAVRLETANGPGGSLTLSIGVTCCCGDEEAAALISRADKALYEAKRTGRDRACGESDRPSEPSFTAEYGHSTMSTLPGGVQTG